MPIKRNEIIEVGQHVGLPSSGNFEDGFSRVGTIEEIMPFELGQSDLVAATVRTDNFRHYMWNFVKTTGFELYRDEVNCNVT